MKLQYVERASTELPLASLIDCVFLLLCYFLTTTDFQKPDNFVESPLPDLGDKPSEASNSKDDEVRIRIEQVGEVVNFYYNNQPCSKTELISQTDGFVKSRGDKAVAIIEPAPNVQFQGVVDAFSACKEAKMPKVLFPSPGGKKSTPAPDASPIP